MKSFNEKLHEIFSNADAMEFCKDKSIEEVWAQCERGDWMLRLYSKSSVYDERKAILANGYCAGTVKHLMKNERSRKAVDAAIAFGNGEITEDELQVAFTSANNAWLLAANAAADADANVYGNYYTDEFPYGHNAPVSAASAALAATITGIIDGVAISAADAAAAAYFYTEHDNAAAARKENLKKTADICRKYLPVPTFE